MTMDKKDETVDRQQLERQIALLQEEKKELANRVKTLSLQSREKSTLIRNLFDYLPNGVIVFDHNRNVIQGNQAAADILLVNKQQIIGRNCRELFSCYEKNNACPVLDDEKSLNKVRTQCLTENRLLLRSAVLNKEANNPVIVETLVDITELENAHREKTLALQSKSNFLANVSHELRTPMHAIMGCTSLLSAKTDVLPDSIKSYLEIMDTSANRLWSLIEKLFDASNLEEDSLSLQLNEIDLETFFSELEKDFRMRVGESRNQIMFSHQNCQQKIIADSIRLQQIIMTLLENASKYTEHGQINCSACIVEIKSHQVLKVSITDNGIGISNQKQQLVFNLFEQEDGASNRSYQGAGLGLAIARQLANLMGGDISLQSEQGAGSTFTLRIPVEIRT